MKKQGGHHGRPYLYIAMSGIPDRIDATNIIVLLEITRKILEDFELFVTVPTDAKTSSGKGDQQWPPFFVLFSFLLPFYFCLSLN